MSTTQRPNRRIGLAETPTGPITARHFTTITEPIRDRGSDEVVVRVHYALAHPAARAAMTTTIPFPRTNPGDGILTAVVGEVVDGPVSGLRPGTLVTGFGGWEDYLLARVSEIREVPDRPRPYEHIGLLGLNGLAAYFGVVEIGKVGPGDTCVVSAAAGGVGHLAGQLARIAGARAIGITSSDTKNDTLVTELGFAAAVNRHSDDVTGQLLALCPDGVDVYFDNVAGPLLETMVPLMAHRGRIVCCGSTAEYDSADDATRTTGPRGIPQLLINNALRMEGFLPADYAAQWQQALDRLTGWADAGDLVQLTDVRDGLDSAPQALVDLLAGRNLGQMVIRVDDATTTESD